MPSNLLVEGDIIALISGDIAPGDAYLLESENNAAVGTEKILRGYNYNEYNKEYIHIQYYINIINKGSKIPSIRNCPVSLNSIVNATDKLINLLDDLLDSGKTESNLNNESVHI